MLQLTRLSGPTFALNPDLIERAEATPDTVVTLVNGSKYVIRESVDELVELVRVYRADLVLAASRTSAPGRHGTSSHSAGGPAAAPAHSRGATVVQLRADHGEA